MNKIKRVSLITLIIIGIGLVGFILTMYSTQPAYDTPPNGNFSFSQVSNSNSTDALAVQITYQDGPAIPQNKLILTGSGFTDGSDSNISTRSHWPVSATSGSENTVVPGDTLTIGVASEYEIQVIWESEDGDNSAILALCNSSDRSSMPTATIT